MGSSICPLQVLSIANLSIAKITKVNTKVLNCAIFLNPSLKVFLVARKYLNILNCFRNLQSNIQYSQETSQNLWRQHGKQNSELRLLTHHYIDSYSTIIWETPKIEIKRIKNRRGQRKKKNNPSQGEKWKTDSKERKQTIKFQDYTPIKQDINTVNRIITDIATHNNSNAYAYIQFQQK